LKFKFVAGSERFWRSAWILLILSGVASCHGSGPLAQCALFPVEQLQSAWCSRAYACLMSGYSGSYGSIGASASECSERSDIAFTQQLFADLGGVAAASEYENQYPSRFLGCQEAVFSASCSDLEPAGPLRSGSGYCSASYLKGEPTVLPDRSCNDLIVGDSGSYER
jgi:hypothetical protein